MRKLALVSLVVLAACGGGSKKDVAGPRPSLAPGVEGEITWVDCGSNHQCGALAVPIDAENPSAGTMELALTRHLARKPAERIGSLIVNPGGPGVGGLFLAEQAAAIYGDVLLDRFDIVAFDPRGVGESRPAIDCVDDLDPYFTPDPTPDDANEVQALADASQEFADACAARTDPKVLAHVSTREAAMDIDRIRAALGEEKISYFGFSYGSELGATWATLYPDTVRAAVLDSSAAPNPDPEQYAIETGTALDAALGRFLSQCADDTKCPFDGGKSPAAAYTELMQRLDGDPITVSDERPAVNEAIADYAVIKALYDSDTWDTLARHLDEARDGDASGLLADYDAYMGRAKDGTTSNELEAFIAIDCVDSQIRDRDEIDRINDAVAQAAPLIGSMRTLPYRCVDWSAQPGSPVEITGTGAGPILVIGNTEDPITPITGGRAMADALEGGVFVTVKADQHIVYGVSDCGDRAIEDYLVELTVPADGTTC